MPFPQPAGYYGLLLSEELEQEICNLTYIETAHVIYDLASHLSGCGNSERFYYTKFEEINSLSLTKKIDFLRWLGDRLAFLHTVPVQESFDPLFDIHQALEVKS